MPLCEHHCVPRCHYLARLTECKIKSDKCQDSMSTDTVMTTEQGASELPVPVFSTMTSNHRQQLRYSQPQPQFKEDPVSAHDDQCTGNDG